MEIFRVDWIDSKFYIGVLSYNSMTWQPWGYRYMSQHGCTVDSRQIDLAMPFDTREEAEQKVLKLKQEM